ncbi:MAG: DUF2752 domain-containing protein [Planctomycetota bacterium]|nr:DUF2752 domain-containing protein [Planctomycetota bacterium]
MTQSPQSLPVAAGGPSPEVDQGGRIGHAVAAGLLLVVFAASFIGVDRWRLPGISLIGGEGSTTCLLRRATGLPCATCGMTRSFCAIGRGEFGAAFAQHPLGPVLYAFFALVMLRSAVVAVTGRRVWPRLARTFVWAAAALVAAILVVWVVRLCEMVAGGEAAEAWRESPLGRLLS